MSEVPHSLVVLGGGVIGCEYACTFAALGIPVTLVESRTPLLSFLDLEMSTRLKARMEGLGVQFRMPATRRDGGGGGGAHHARAARTAGPSPPRRCWSPRAGAANTADIGLEEAGVTLGERGRVVVERALPDDRPQHLRRRRLRRLPRAGLHVDGAGPGGDGARLLALPEGRSSRPSCPTGCTPSPSCRWPARPRSRSSRRAWTTWWGVRPTPPTPAGRSSATAAAS